MNYFDEAFLPRDGQSLCSALHVADAAVSRCCKDCIPVGLEKLNQGRLSTVGPLYVPTAYREGLMLPCPAPALQATLGITCFWLVLSGCTLYSVPFTLYSVAARELHLHCTVFPVAGLLQLLRTSISSLSQLCFLLQSFNEWLDGSTLVLALVLTMTEGWFEKYYCPRR